MTKENTYNSSYKKLLFVLFFAALFVSAIQAATNKKITCEIFKIGEPELKTFGNIPVYITITNNSQDTIEIDEAFCFNNVTFKTGNKFEKEIIQKSLSIVPMLGIPIGILCFENPNYSWLKILTQRVPLYMIIATIISYLSYEFGDWIGSKISSNATQYTLQPNASTLLIGFILPKEFEQIENKKLTPEINFITKN